MDALPPGRAVDVACGTGRHARELSRRGWRVVGVDVSTVGVAHPRTLTAGAGLAADVRYEVADARQWAPDRPVDLVLAAYVQLEWPRDPALLHTADQLREVAAGLRVERLDEVLRPDDGGTGVDLVLVAARP